MSDNKVIWHEGMFLCSHHFQQQERYLENYSSSSFKMLIPNGWGFDQLDIDNELLELGKFAFKEARGLMADGTPFDFPVKNPLPPPLTLQKGMKDSVIYFRLANYNSSSAYAIYKDAKTSNSRYIRTEEDIVDFTDGVTRSEKVEVGQLNGHFALESEGTDGYTCIPVAQITEVKPDGKIVLDKSFIPPCLSIQNNLWLSGFLKETQGMLAQRGAALSLRHSQVTQGGSTASIADFMLLLVINRYLAEIDHIQHAKKTHPEDLFLKLLALVGELSTFFALDKQLKQLPQYQHENLRSSFVPLRKEVAKLLSAVFEQNAIQLDIEERKHGVKVAKIPDRKLVDEATFVLAVKADIPVRELQNSFPGQLKLGTVENIATLVNNQLIGIGIEPISVTPREIPVHAGYHYYNIDTSSEHWTSLRKTGGFAMHISGDYPGLMLELWAVRK